VARHTANVVLLRRYEMSTLINRKRRGPFASVTVRHNRRVCEGRVASDKSRGKCISASSKNGQADEFPNGVPRRVVRDCRIVLSFLRIADRRERTTLGKGDNQKATIRNKCRSRTIEKKEASGRMMRNNA